MNINLLDISYVHDHDMLPILLAFLAMNSTTTNVPHLCHVGESLIYYEYWILVTKQESLTTLIWETWGSRHMYH